jgi:hypothetical protein
MPYRPQSVTIGCTVCPAGSYSEAIGAVSTCTLCPAGTSSVGYGPGQLSASVCTPCSAGVATCPGSSSCNTCRTGYMWCDPAGGGECQPCPPGKFSFEYRAAFSVEEGCQVCPAGRYSDPSSVTACTECDKGKYMDAAASGASSSSACLQCSAGRYSNSSSSTECYPCQKGTYQDQLGMSGCVSCPAGQYGDTAGGGTLAACKGCGANKTSVDGGTSCFCRDGYYMNVEDECEPCPAGARCEGGGADGATLSLLFIEPGFWRSSANSSVVLECPLAGSCIGGNVTADAMCAEGNSGALCAVCADGYYLSPGGLCTICSGSAGQPGFVFGLLSLAVALFLFAVLFGALHLQRGGGGGGGGGGQRKLLTAGVFEGARRLLRRVSDRLTPWSLQQTARSKRALAVLKLLITLYQVVRAQQSEACCVMACLPLDLSTALPCFTHISAA